MTTPILPRIGLVGRKRTGKSALAEHLVTNYFYRAMAFADPLREMAARLDPIVGLSVLDARPFRYKRALALYGYEDAKDRFPEFRRVLQVLGTEAVRGVLGEDVWVDLLAAKVDALPAQRPVVVTDVRFPNEVEVLKDRGFIIVRMERPGLDTSDAHPSETALDGHPVDVVFRNGGTLGGLYGFGDWLVGDYWEGLQ